MAEDQVLQNQVIGEVGAGNGNMNDPLFLSNSDHPGAQLVAAPFTGLNFLSWSRGIKMALGAKYKIGFIDGSTDLDSVSPADVQRWKRCDYMVRCWIVNSMSASIAEGFMYSDSAKGLWNEIVERYSQTNGHLLYQLRKSLCNQTQGSSSIAEYFNKVKKLWDEILTLEGVL